MGGKQKSGGRAKIKIMHRQIRICASSVISKLWASLGANHQALADGADEIVDHLLLRPAAKN